MKHNLTYNLPDFYHFKLHFIQVSDFPYLCKKPQPELGLFVDSVNDEAFTVKAAMLHSYKD
jgi:hypothetical protein